MSFLSRFGTEAVAIVRNPDTDSEERIEVNAHIQGEAGFFPVETPIYEGDTVEIQDPRGGIDRRLAAKVKINNVGPVGMRHTKVSWGKASPKRVAAVRRLTFENLHPIVQRAAGDLFADGHYASAIFEAFKAIEIEVKRRSGLNDTGTHLMTRAFNPSNPVIDISVESGKSGQDEQEGFKHLFMGAIMGIRNPKAHSAIQQLDPQRALEYLGFASVLLRRLDDASVPTETEA